jgi:AraC-like DNA-binding protein
MQTPMELHRHEFLEIVVVLGGQGTYATPGHARPIRTGDVLVVNSSHSHGYENTQDLELANILVREDVLRDVEKELGVLPGYHALFTLKRLRRPGSGGHVHLAAEALNLVETWIRSIEAESERLDEGGGFLTKVWLFLLIGLLARFYGKQERSSLRLEMRLGRILSAIDLNPEKPFSLPSLAALAAMSERSFLRHFKEISGVPPMEYVLRARIRKAVRLMDERPSQCSITETAFACGFNDSNYFSRQFRQITGVSPRSYLTRTRRFSGR